MPTKLFVSKLTPEQWADARRLRAEGASFGDLGARFGLKPGTMRARARKERWPAPRRGASPHQPVGLAKLPRTSPATADTRRRLAQQLYGLVALEIRMMELSMHKKLDDRERAPSADLSTLNKEERESFSALIERINQVTEMASEPASAADGRRKSAALNFELTALSDDIDAAALAAASQKDDLRREIADKLEKLVPPSSGA